MTDADSATGELVLLQLILGRQKIKAIFRDTQARGVAATRSCSSVPHRECILVLRLLCRLADIAANAGEMKCWTF